VLHYASSRARWSQDLPTNLKSNTANLDTVMTHMLFVHDASWPSRPRDQSLHICWINQIQTCVRDYASPRARWSQDLLTNLNSNNANLYAGMPHMLSCTMPRGRQSLVTNHSTNENQTCVLDYASTRARWSADLPTNLNSNNANLDTFMIPMLFVHDASWPSRPRDQSLHISCIKELRTCLRDYASARSRLSSRASGCRHVQLLFVGGYC
jgi:hypothetical protein